ncbi:MAG: hypothetical protein R3B70_19560, partial [Polyangiaceae bacterium]
SRGCSGIEAARGRYRDPVKLVDEHRRIFEQAVQQAGLPASVLETKRLAVLTDVSSNVVLGGKGLTSTVDLLPPQTAQRAVFRSFAIDELAQLPDFSYSLWDWARGNETCPLDPLPSPHGDAQECHAFETHMGATNSNHFPPQSDNWFAHYHALALTRAAECTAQRNDIWAAAPTTEQAARDARFASFFRACEVEALTYEAVAQHYLQDSWSAGHMWERWGTTTLDAFPEVLATGAGSADATWNGLDTRFRKLLVAEMVAISAGTIHGSDPPFFETVPGGFTLHDALCYPTEEVKAVKGGSIYNVVGDLHLHDVTGAPPAHGDISLTGLPYDVSALSQQSQGLLNCAAGSVGQVYTALKGQGTFGDPVLGAQMGSAPMFNAAACTAPRVTNAAMHEGINPTDLQPASGEALKVLIGDIPGSVESTARNDYGRLRHAAWIASKLENGPEAKADTTEIAQLYIPQSFEYTDQFCDELGTCQDIVYKAEEGLYTMLKVEPNRCYTAGGGPGCTVTPPGAGAPLAPFVDQPVPAMLPMPDPAEPTGAVALAFHTSRAPQLCDVLTAADLAALPTVVEYAETGIERAAACDACAEWIAPFLRIGNDATDYDTSAEPLCHHTAADPAMVPYVYEPGTGTSDPLALARRRCGCKGLVAVTNAGLQRLTASPTGGSMSLTLDGPTVPVGNLPRDLAAASEGRLLVSNGNGQIVGVRDTVEVDLDGDAGNGVTRLTFSGVSDIQGIAVTNANAKELLLAVTPGTGELITYDLTNHMECDRFSVAEVAGQGAYDVAVSADGSKVWISLRKLSPLSGTLASVSLPALAQCNGTAAATLAFLAPPGAASGLGPMALSPDGSRLAVGGRLSSTCLDQIKTAGGTNVDTQVGCDRVYVLDVATNTWLTFGSQLSMPTRPGRYPYAVAWFEDSIRMAFASFQGIDNFGSGDSGWPASFQAVPRIPVGGTLRLADTSNPSYQGGGGASGPRNWTYNMPLQSAVIGETVVVDGGAFYGSGWVFVATSTGRVSAYSVAPHEAAQDPMWEASTADPETALHLSTNGAWYGGCRHTCQLVGGYCPDVCGAGTIPAGFGSIELGSSVRVLKSF